MAGERPLEGKRILLIEDDFYLADDEKHLLKRAGATVIGPFGSGCRAEDVTGAGALDGAVIDINLGQGPQFEFARLLSELSVPFVFVTGYDAAVLPPDLAHVPRVEKPIRERDLIARLAGVVTAPAHAELSSPRT